MNRKHAAKIWPFVKAFGEGKKITCRGATDEHFDFHSVPEHYAIVPDLITLPLTLRQSLEITRDMWDWLAENPGEEKHQWPGWISNGGHVPEVQSLCACCAYQINQTSSAPGIVSSVTNCSRCPLKDHWVRTGSIACTKKGSPFCAWTDDSYNNEAAKQIADAARAELEKLDAQKEKKYPGYKPYIESKESTDPYKPFKDAIAQGKVVQIFNPYTKEWKTPTSYLGFTDPVEHYRIKPEPKLRPWKPEEVPVGARIINEKQTIDSIILGRDQEKFYYGRPPYPFEKGLQYDHFYFSDAITYIGKLRYSLDHGKTWLPCGIYE